MPRFSSNLFVSVSVALLPWLACTPQAPESAGVSAPGETSEPTAPFEGSTANEPVAGGSGSPVVRVVEGSASPPAPVVGSAEEYLTLRSGVPNGLNAVECGGAPALRCLAATAGGSAVLTWASGADADPVRLDLPETAQRLLPLGELGWTAISHQAATQANPAAASTTLRWTCDGATVREQRWDRALVDLQRVPAGVALLLGGSEPELVWVPASCTDPVTLPLAARTATALRSNVAGTALAVTGLRSRSLEVISLESGSPSEPVEVALPFQPYLLAGTDEGRWATLPANSHEGVWVALAGEARTTMQPLWLPHPLEHVESCGAYWAGWDAATESAWLAGWEPVIEPIVLEGVTDASLIHCIGSGQLGVLAGSQAIFVDASNSAQSVRIDGVSVLWTEAGEWNVVRGDTIYAVTFR